jgi:hypothetical protein
MARVLVVDPGELGELLTTLLVQYGMDAEHARSGEEALERALALPPEVAVIEQDLPDVPGIEVAELVRNELGVKVVLTYPQQLVAEPDDALLARIGKLDGSFLRPFRSLTLVEFCAKLLSAELKRGPDAPAAGGPLTSTEGAPVLDDASEELLLDIPVDVEVKDEPSGDSDAPSAAQPLRERIAERQFQPGQLTELWQRVKERRNHPSQPPSTSTDGALSPRALADMLDAFHQSQTTGELWLQNGKARRVLFLRRGVIAGARSNVEGEDVVALAHKRGLIDGNGVLAVRDDLKRGVHKNVLDTILARGLLDEPSLKALVAEHVRTVAQRAFMWQTGTYNATFEGRAAKEPVIARLPVGDVIVRGILLNESDHALLEAAPDDARFSPASDSGYGLQDLALSEPEARVVVAMDGTKTIKDLLLLHDSVPERTVRGLAAGLLCIGLVRFVGWGHAEARRIAYF